MKKKDIFMFSPHSISIYEYWMEYILCRRMLHYVCDVFFSLTILLPIYYNLDLDIESLSRNISRIFSQMQCRELHDHSFYTYGLIFDCSGIIMTWSIRLHLYFLFSKIRISIKLNLGWFLQTKYFEPFISVLFSLFEICVTTYKIWTEFLNVILFFDEMTSVSFFVDRVGNMSEEKMVCHCAQYTRWQWTIFTLCNSLWNA